MEETSTQTTEATTQQGEATTEATVIDDNGATISETTYLDGKYKSVSELEKGYRELQSSYSKKLGAFEGAPEAYELAEGIESNSRIEALQEWGKENQLSNKALNEIIQMDIEKQQAEMAEYIISEKAKLGSNADARLQNVTDWAKANFGEDAIGPLGDMLTSAEGVKLFEKIIKASQGTAPAPSQPAQKVDAEQIRQMRFAKDEYGNRRMSSDPAYRAKVIALEQQLYS